MSVSSRFRRRVWLIAAFALATAGPFHALLDAQGERITLPRKPGPNQTLTVHLTQDMDMQMSMANSNAEADAPNQQSQPQSSQPQGQPPRAMPPMKLSGAMTMEGTQKVGETDDEGRTPCEFTYTDASMDMKMNGMSVPNQDFKDQFVGKSMTFMYAPDGTITNMKLPDTAGPTAGVQSTVQQALNAFTISMPTQPLSIGESAKMPFTAPLAMPLPGGQKPPSFVGTVTYTLVRVEGSGRNRVAVLDQKVDATATGALPAPGSQSGAKLMMHMIGTGQVQVDLARGFARSGEIQTTMDGSITRTGGQTQPGMPGDVHLQGSTKMKMSTSPQDR
jgi:hypothetical protein